MPICQMCKKEFPVDELLKQESTGMLFCKNDFSNGTVIIGLIEYSKEHPDYKHPNLPKPIPRTANFDEVLKIYREFIGEF